MTKDRVGVYFYVDKVFIFRILAVSTIEPVNTQQILQMGGHVEKIQQTLQHLQMTTAEQLDAERSQLDEMKRTEVQDADQTAEGHGVNPDAKGSRRRLRIRKVVATDAEKVVATPSSKEEPYHGQRINLVI